MLLRRRRRHVPQRRRWWHIRVRDVLCLVQVLIVCGWRRRHGGGWIVRRLVIFVFILRRAFGSARLNFLYVWPGTARVNDDAEHAIRWHGLTRF